MKIIFVIPNMTGGGTERVISLLSDAYVKMGFEVAIMQFAGYEHAYQLNDKVEDFKVVSFYGSETDREMLEYINSYRREVGLGNLQLSENLNKAATLRAVELALSFSHTRPNGLSWPSVLSEFSISYSFAAENVSYGYGTSLDSAEKAAKAFRNSEGHYQNMISSSINYMGVGKYIQNGSTYWAIIFTS